MTETIDGRKNLQGHEHGLPELDRTVLLVAKHGKASSQSFGPQSRPSLHDLVDQRSGDRISCGCLRGLFLETSRPKPSKRPDPPPSPRCPGRRRKASHRSKQPTDGDLGTEYEKLQWGNLHEASNIEMWSTCAAHLRSLHPTLCDTKRDKDPISSPYAQTKKAAMCL